MRGVKTTRMAPAASREKMSSMLLETSAGKWWLLASLWGVLGSACVIQSSVATAGDPGPPLHVEPLTKKTLIFSRPEPARSASLAEPMPSVPPSGSAAPAAGTPGDAKEKVVRFPLRSGGPEVTVRYEYGSSLIAHVLVDGKEVQQEASRGPKEWSCSLRAEAPEGAAQDFNFDGYADVELFSCTDSTKKHGEVYLYDPKSKTFQFSKELFDLPNLGREAKMPVVSSVSAGEQGRSHEYYRWRKGHLIPYLAFTHDAGSGEYKLSGEKKGKFAPIGSFKEPGEVLSLDKLLKRLRWPVPR